MRLALADLAVAAALMFATTSGCKRSSSVALGGSDGGAGSGERAPCAAGAYHIDGAAGGSVAITAGRATCRVRWEADGGAPRDGVGIPSAGSIVVGRSSGKEYGATVYVVRGGTLTGVEAENGYDDLTDEELEGPPDLNGTYRIVRGGSHTGIPYTGQVTITPGAATYAIRWETDCACKKGPRHDSYVGVGVKKGDRLLVAWGSAGSDVELFDYEPSRDGLDGAHARTGDAATTAERLVRTGPGAAAISPDLR